MEKSLTCKQIEELERLPWRPTYHTKMMERHYAQCPECSKRTSGQVHFPYCTKIPAPADPCPSSTTFIDCSSGKCESVI